MRNFLLIITIIIASCNTQTQTTKVWTEDYEQAKFKELDEVMRPRFPEDNRRMQLIYYVLKHLKEKLPNGLESIPVDSLSKLSAEIAVNYAYTQQGQHENSLIPTAVTWSPLIESAFRQASLKDVKPENLDNANKICDCFLKKLHKVYPDKVILPLPRDVVQKIGAACHEEMPDVTF